MNSLWLRLLNSQWVNSKLISVVNHAASAVAGVLLAWLLNRGADRTDATSLTQDLATILVLGASIGFSMLKAKINSSQQKVAAASPARDVPLSPAETQLVEKAWANATVPVQAPGAVPPPPPAGQ